MDEKGFTLVELLVAIAIIGALIILLTNVLFNNSKNTTDRLGEQMENNLKDAARLYAIDNRLKNCHNCQSDNLNTNCVPVGTEDSEKAACRAIGINVTLGALKNGNYFEDVANHCYKMNGNVRMNDNDINIFIYRYKSDYIVELDGISCKK